MKIKVGDIDRHRNGICGEPFYVVLFSWKDDEGKTRRMMATVFDGSVPNDLGETLDNGAPRVAVLDRDELAAGNIAMGDGNSWRGDHFADALVSAIQSHNERLWGAGAKLV